MSERSFKKIWVEVLRTTPLFIRRRASMYLRNVQRVAEGEWVVWSQGGTRYHVHLEGNRVVCSCPYFQQEKGYCKHICAVAVLELTEIDVIPWLKKLEENL